MRRISLLEPLAIFGLIVAYIWRMRALLPWSWVVILGLILLSHMLRGERPPELGWRTEGFLACLRRYGPWVALSAAIGLGIAALAGTLRPMSARGIALDLGLYLLWGVAQEYLLNGYMLRRLESALSPVKAGAAAAVLFSLAHIPNWFLMIATLVGGYAATVVYRKRRNLYFLGIAHAVLGFTIFAAAPDRLIHHLRVGPEWFRPLKDDAPVSPIRSHKRTPGSSPLTNFLQQRHNVTPMKRLAGAVPSPSPEPRWTYSAKTSAEKKPSAGRSRS